MMHGYKTKCVYPNYVEYLPDFPVKYVHDNFNTLVSFSGSLSSLETLKLDENDLLFLPPSIGR